MGKEEEEEEREGAEESLAPTHHSLARRGVQRSITLALRHDGFQSASPEALESFTNMVEVCQLMSTLQYPVCPPTDHGRRSRVARDGDQAICHGC